MGDGQLSYDSVEVLIYDPVSANRTATRAALYALGFRRTETVSTLEAFVDAIQKSPPDIVLCEAQGAAEELVRRHPAAAPGRRGLQSLHRHHRHRLGKEHRPDQPGGFQRRRRSVAAALFHRAAGQRIEAHIERRKGFVITTDYVGPDRRKDNGRAVQTSNCSSRPIR